MISGYDGVGCTGRQKVPLGSSMEWRKRGGGGVGLTKLLSW